MKKIVAKTATVFVGGTLVAFTLLVNVDTYSWFSDQAIQRINVSSASTEDFIKDVEIINKCGSSVAIKLTKSENCKSNPILYFSVHGKASEYILHINPVKLNERGEYIIPIEPDINVNQFLKLFVRPWTPIKGTLRIKYLNEFIDEEYEIQLSRSYLIQRFWQNIERKEIKFTKIDDDPESRKEVSNLITYIARHLDWDNNQDSNAGNNVRMLSSNQMSIASSNQSKEAEAQGQMEIVKSPIGKLVLSSEQVQIINTIAPKLISHLEELYSTINNFVDRLNKKIAENDRLKLENEKLVMNIEVLEAERDNLLGENEGLEDAKNALEEKIKRLESTIVKLNKEINRLESELQASAPPVDGEEGEGQTGSPGEEANVDDEDPGSSQGDEGANLETPAQPADDEEDNDDSNVPAEEANVDDGDTGSSQEGEEVDSEALAQPTDDEEEDDESNGPTEEAGIDDGNTGSSQEGEEVNPETLAQPTDDEEEDEESNGPAEEVDVDDGGASGSSQEGEEVDSGTAATQSTDEGEQAGNPQGTDGVKEE